MKKITIVALLSIFLIPFYASAHRSGCHRWHSCPSDTGSYTCGDLGYACQYSTTSSVTGKSYPGYDLITPIRKGAQGMRVSNLQEALSSDETIYPEALITGYFGNATKRAVKRFQRVHGLTADGVADTKTIDKIKEIYGVDLSQ